MRQIQVTVPWQEGLHLRPAGKLVRIAKGFRSQIFLKGAGKIADMRSILSIISLCATMGTPLDVVAVGDDERDATCAIEQAFSGHAVENVESVAPQKW